MVRSYFRHGPTECFGIIASASSPSLYDGKYAYVPALEDVLIWDTKKGESVGTLHETGLKSEVTCIARSSFDKDIFAVGYANGSIRIWSLKSKSVNIVFNGHRRAITALAFSGDGSRLVSGGLDTEIVLWDIIGESGMFRLRGHRGQITGLAFLPNSTDSEPPSTSLNLPSSSRLLTASKDTYLKLWDLSTQHCVETVVAHRHEVWDFEILTGESVSDNDSPDDIVVVTVGGEGESKAWTIPSTDQVGITASSDSTMTDGETSRAIKPLASSLALASTSHSQRVSQISYNPKSSFLALQTGERTIEVMRLRTEEEIKKKISRRRRRDREKKKDKNRNEDRMDVDGDRVDNDEHDVEHGGYEWKNRLASWITIRTNSKIRSISWGDQFSPSKSSKSKAQLLVAYNSNLLDVYGFPVPGPSKVLQEATRIHSLEIPGHRTDVRTLCVSSDDELLASASNGALKVWNVKTTKCLRTMECGYAICSSFLPGDRHILVGTKSGELRLYDVSASSLTATYQAHEGPLWSLQIRPDGKGAVTGSADKDVKFWDFEVQEIPRETEDGGENQTVQKLGLVHTRTLKMTDDVLGVRYSPNGVLLAVSLLDSTVKVFFADTLKFFLSLYGHKLPVLSLDISHDSKLIVTCSADKNVKIWGLDFGDCHRSLFAHDDSIMQVAFEKDSHYFWTAGKDRLVKYWDGDKFEMIQKLEGHHSEIWALAVSSKGNFVITASHDKSIRTWEKMDEPLFLEEEREREMEELFEANLTMNDETFTITRPGDTAEPLEAQSVRHQTNESLTAGEKIMEALETAESDQNVMKSYNEDLQRLPPEAAKSLPRPTRNPIFAYQDVPAEIYVLNVIRKIPPSALQDSLLVLPFSKVGLLFGHLNYWAERSLDISLTARVLFFLLEVHHNQIIANRLMRDVLLKLRKNLSISLSTQKDTVGYNLAALRHLRSKNDSERIGTYMEQEGFDEEKVKERISEAAKKRKRGIVKA